MKALDRGRPQATGVIDLGHEIIRNSRTIEEAIAVVSRHKVASTWGIVVTSAREKNAAIIETTAKKMRVTHIATRPVAGRINPTAILAIILIIVLSVVLTR